MHCKSLKWWLILFPVLPLFEVVTWIWSLQKKTFWQVLLARVVRPSEKWDTFLSFLSSLRLAKHSCARPARWNFPFDNSWLSICCLLILIIIMIRSVLNVKRLPLACVSGSNYSVHVYIECFGERERRATGTKSSTSSLSDYNANANAYSSTARARRHCRCRCCCCCFRSEKASTKSELFRFQRVHKCCTTCVCVFASCEWQQTARTATSPPYSQFARIVLAAPVILYTRQQWW